nr:tripartite tricarboxylate transporter substrate-binding protein [Variovorax sp. KBS0712]
MTLPLLRRHFLQRIGFAAACALPHLSHAASPWPSRPVRLIVVYPPGGVSDGMARALAEPLAQSLGVPVLIEHRAGAGGSLGMDALARATPDGHTLAFSAISPLTLHPLLARARPTTRCAPSCPWPA